jgi:hypothetical protein
MVSRYSTKDIANPASNNAIITKATPNTFPVQIMLHGTVASGAPINIHYPGREPFLTHPTSNNEFKAIREKFV